VLALLLLLLLLLQPQLRPEEAHSARAVGALSAVAAVQGTLSG
jgi:hypothetical protein